MATAAIAQSVADRIVDVVLRLRFWNRGPCFSYVYGPTPFAQAEAGDDGREYPCQLGERRLLVVSIHLARRC